MTDLTPETLAEWRKDAKSAAYLEAATLEERKRRILILLDALDTAERLYDGARVIAIEAADDADRMKARAEKAEREARINGEQSDRNHKHAERNRIRAEALGHELSRMKEFADSQEARAEQAEAERCPHRGRDYVRVSTAEKYRARAEVAEVALSRVLTDMETLGMRADGIVDTGGGRWVPCADVLDLIEKYRNDDNAH